MRNYTLYLKDILKAIESIEDFIASGVGSFAR